MLDELVFVGGATVELWVTDEAAPEFRPTEDVDVIVEIATRVDYYRFEVRLRLEAFGSRGEGDLYGSRDFEDVVALVDGREELLGELEAAPAALRGYVFVQLRTLSERHVFDAAVEGALRGGPETAERSERVVRPRIEEILKLGG